MKAVVFSLVAMGFSAGVVYAQCDTCIDSACPSAYLWVEPGFDIYSIGGRGCQYVGNNHCGDAIPCMGAADMRIDLDQLEKLAAFGSASEISTEILANPALELVSHRNAIAVNGCKGVLVALIPIRTAEVVAVTEAVAARMRRTLSTSSTASGVM